MFSGSGKSWFEGMSERLTELAEETRDTPDESEQIRGGDDTSCKKVAECEERPVQGGP